MNKKGMLKKTAALLLALGLTIGATGCDFLVTDSQEDLKQIVATVDISSEMSGDDAMKAYADGMEKLIKEGGLSTEIPKRDLIAYFLNAGYMYVQSYGYTYEDTFNMLMDGLVENKLLTQYAVAYYLSKGVSADGCIEYVNAQTAAATGAEKTLLENNPEVLTMEYFLTEGNQADKREEYDEAVYSMMKSINDSLDSSEQNYVTAQTADDHSHDETRTTPTNVNTAITDYIPKLDNGDINYGIYTGRNTLASCGTYEAIDGSTSTSRKKAYNAFLSNLQGYGLIKEGEDTSDITKLDYYYMELASTLGQALVTKFGEDLKEDAIAALTDDYVQKQYEKIYEAQEYSYKNGTSAFETAIDGVSDDSFVLYGKEGYGFVYNILLPFSASQEQAYSAAKNKGLTQDEIYDVRKELLTQVKAKDLRSAWFCDDTEADDHYAYEKDGKYYFFDNNLNKADEYESLTHYAGKYAYNGTATLTDGEWEFEPNTVDIDAFMTVFESYVNEVSGCEVKPYNDDKYTNGKYNSYADSDYKDANGVYDYSNFVYYAGKVELGEVKSSEFFYKESNSYKALSAVNELMFAYSTDTGCLNSYMGYAVSPYKTDFVSEFEYAAQMAVRGGVGTYVVAPSDYGWHIIYCSFVFGKVENGEYDPNVYGGYNGAEKETEGTFSNLFYESLKSTTASTYVSEAQTKVLNGYKDAATYHKDAYQDLLDLDEE